MDGLGFNAKIPKPLGQRFRPLLRRRCPLFCRLGLFRIRQDQITIHICPLQPVPLHTLKRSRPALQPHLPFWNFNVLLRLGDRFILPSSKYPQFLTVAIE
jgi:hypothetical protein